MGLNGISKKYFMTKMDITTYDCIDLDLISSEIIKDYDMDKLFRQYENLKSKKNERYKDIGKKMTAFWEKNFNDLIRDNIKSDKKVILIGKNHHYKQLSKKINLPTTNKFFVKTNMKQDIEEIIEHNLDNYRNDIIKGIFPTNYLNFDYLMKQKIALRDSYLKSGYLEKTIPQINTILNLLSKKKIKGKGLYISMKDSYNLNSKIHPKKNSKIFAYSEPVLALLGSFRFNDDELVKSYHKNRVKIKEMKNGILKKLKKKRFLYLVDSKTFIPHEKGSNVKFFSQAPVPVVDKEKIDNVYEILNDISVFQ